jgi:hypothetical protein
MCFGKLVAYRGADFIVAPVGGGEALDVGALFRCPKQ